MAVCSPLVRNDMQSQSRSMLKQLRHISEGNFYGLHVTNKAEKLCLEKELKTLEACQDAQSHGYRKEEKELVETLRRLNRSKDPNHEGETEKHHDGADDVSISHESGLVFAKPAAGVSNVSIVIPLSPVETSTADSTEELAGERVSLPVNSGEALGVGSELHRTTGFTDCALCRLPKFERGQGREAGRICTCGPEHRRHIHVDKYHDENDKRHKKSAKKHTKEDMINAVQERDRRKSLETEHHVHDFLATLSKDHGATNGHGKPQGKRQSGAPNSRSDNNGGDRRTSIGERHERRESNPWGSVEGIGTQRQGSTAEHLDFPSRSRRSSIEEQYGHRSRRGSLEEYARFAAPGRRESYTEYNHSRRGSYAEHQSRRGSYSERNNNNNGSSSKKAVSDDEHYRRQGFGFEGRKSRRSSLDAGSFPPMYKAKTVSTAGDVYHLRAPPQLPNIHPPHQMAVFHGLVHPDNIINHHHFLPHEAEKHDHPRRAGFDRSRSYHHHGDHSYSHAAAAFDRRHEQDCSTYHTISTLRRMLHTYQDKEKEDTPKYPWPRPPVVEFTTEEFQKLKKCRYLRLPRRCGEEDEFEELGNGASRES